MSLGFEFDFKKPDYDRVWIERAERLANLRSGGVDISALRAHYKDHPVDFMTDWLVTVDPRNLDIGLPAVVPFILFKRQEEFVTWVVERWKNREDWLCEKSRDMGISWVCVGIAIWMWLYYPGSVVGFGSRKEEYVDKLGDPKSLFWKIRAAIDMLPQELQPVGYKSGVHDPHMRIVNPESGAAIVGEAGDNIGRGNRTTLYFVDESAHLERAESVDAALSQTSNCKGHVSTVNGVGNLFHRKRHSGKVKVFVFDWRDDPRKDQAWYEKQKEQLEPEVLAQEVDRDYNASTTDSYISGKLVTQAMAIGPADVVPMGPLKVGIDVARFGNDKTVFTARQGRLCYKQETFGQADVVDVAGRAIDWIRLLPEKPAQIAVDVIGLGAGVADILRRDPVYGKLVVDVNSSIRLDDGQNYNLRARMWRDMRDWLRGGRVSLPKDDELATDLTVLRYSYRDSNLLIESKKDAKARGVKSPDKSDSLALTFAEEVKEREETMPTSPAWQELDALAGY